MTIDGPTHLPQSSIYYPIKARIHYHSDENAQGPVTFSVGQSPLAQREALEFRYKLYRSGDADYDNTVRFMRSQPYIRPHEARENPIAVPISQEGGFVELSPGESKVFDLRIKLDYWLASLEAGTKYWFRYIGRNLAIPHWRRGSLKVGIRSSFVSFDTSLTLCHSLGMEKCTIRQ